MLRRAGDFEPLVSERVFNLWVQASLDQRQRFHQLFFPDGIAFDGKRLIGTGATAPAFSYLRGIETGNEGLVDLTGVAPTGRAEGEAVCLTTVRSANDRAYREKLVAGVEPA